MAAVRGCGQPDQETTHLVFIRDTLSLDHFWISPGLRQAVESRPELRVVEEVPLRFDKRGEMVRPWSLGEPD